MKVQHSYQQCWRKRFLCPKECHLFLQLPLVKSTRDYTILSLDGSRQVEERPEDGSSRATVHSILDHYTQRPADSVFEDMTLLFFAQHYSIQRTLVLSPNDRK